MRTVIIQHPVIIAVGFVIAALAAFLFYRKDTKLSETNPVILNLMRFLRFVSLFLIFILLASVVIRKNNIQIQEPVVLVLQDNTISLKSAMTGQELEKHNKELEKLTKKLNKTFDSKLLCFDDKVYTCNTPEYNGNITNITKALEDINSRYYKQNLAAVVLISDGIYNRGFSPENIAGKLPFKIYCIGMGDTTVYRDLAIKEIIANQYVYQGNKFPVKVRMEADKAKGIETFLTVKYDNKTIEKKKLKITSDKYDTTLTYTIKADEAGVHTIKAIVGTAEGERNKINNRLERNVEVINTKKKILILSDFPHPDIAAIRRAFKDITGTETEYKTTDKAPKNLDKYDLIVLYQLPGKKSSAKSIFKTISQKEIPFLLITGQKTDYFAFNALNTGVKFDLRGNQFDEATAVYNPDFSLFEPPEGLKTLSGNYPPLITPFAQITVKGDTSVLFYKRIKGIATEEPVFVFFRNNPLNNNKAGFILGEGIWRWPMYEYKSQKSNKVTETLLRKSLQYLLVDKQKGRFSIKYKKNVQKTEDITFEAQLFDMSYNPVKQAVIDIKITDTTGHEYKYTFNNNGDFYSLNIGKLPKGKYKFAARATDGKDILTYTGQFNVIANNLELQNTRANFELLKKIAYQSGGDFIPYDSLQYLPGIIKRKTDSTPVRKTTFILEELINLRWLCFVILFTLVAEWILRKYSGTI